MYNESPSDAHTMIEKLSPFVGGTSTPQNRDVFRLSFPTLLDGLGKSEFRSWNTGACQLLRCLVLLICLLISLRLLHHLISLSPRAPLSPSAVSSPLCKCNTPTPLTSALHPTSFPLVIGRTTKGFNFVGWTI